MNRKVFDQEDGLPVEVVSGDVLDVVGTVRLMPNRDDNEFRKVKVG